VGRSSTASATPTCILLPYRDRNAFIAECKIWDGPKKFADAIDQLLGRYVAWRDTKGALILFIKRGDATRIIDAAAGLMRAHRAYRAARPAPHPYERQDFQFVSLLDDQRRIQVALLPIVIATASGSARAPRAPTGLDPQTVGDHVSSTSSGHVPGLLDPSPISGPVALDRYLSPGRSAWIVDRDSYADALATVRPCCWRPAGTLRARHTSMTAGQQVAMPAQHCFWAYQQPDPAQHFAGISMQQRGEQGPISGGEPDLHTVHLPFDDNDLVAQGEDLGVLGPVAHGPQPQHRQRVGHAGWASLNSATTRNHHPVTISDPTCSQM
jgi:hypothetical protein